MRRYGLNKHILELSPESFLLYNNHLEHHSRSRRLSSIGSG